MSAPSARVLVLDNRDSFVFNLVAEFEDLGAATLTVRSGLTLTQLERHLARFDPDLTVLSPGPGHPGEAGGIMVEWLRTGPAVPVLGICLGLQAIAVAAGGRLARAPRPVHGRTSPIHLRPDPLFASLPSPIVAARYHSLVVAEVPPSLEVIATTRDEDGELVMALRHRALCQVGFQFHPESILTPHGSLLLAACLDEALRRRNEPRPR